jgi:hypothetical protein
LQLPQLQLPRLRVLPLLPRRRLMEYPTEGHAGAPTQRAPALRWSADITWTVAAGASPPARVIFNRGASPLLELDVAPTVVDFLARSGEGHGALPLAPPALNPFLRLLEDRRIVQRAPEARAAVSFYTACETLMDACHLPSARPVAIDLLVGDEATLQAAFPAFVAARARPTLVATVAIHADRLEIGPLRLPDETAAPVTRAPMAQHYPAWRERLGYALGAVREVLAQACQGPAWFSLSARGVRMTWRWEEADAPYVVESAPLTPPPGCIDLAYARASLEGGLVSGGTAESAAEADLAARCEAWERFCMSRADLGAPADDDARDAFDDLPGVAVRFLRDLTHPLRGGPEACAGWFLADERPCRVPARYVYFQDHPSAVTNTSGAAYGATLADAVDSGRLELIERHALLRAYLQGVHGREVPAAELDGSVQALVTRAPRHRPRFYHLSRGAGVDVVVCVLTASTPPFVSLGAAARRSVSAAARKAFFEAAALDVDYATQLERTGPRAFLERARAWRDAPPHTVGLVEGAWVWAGMPEGAALLHGIFGGADAPANERLDPGGFVVVELGTRIVPDAHVVKVLHPDALPLPSYHAHALHLAGLLGVPPPLPMPFA